MKNTPTSKPPVSTINLSVDKDQAIQIGMFVATILLEASLFIGLGFYVKSQLDRVVVNRPYTYNVKTTDGNTTVVPLSQQEVIQLQATSEFGLQCASNTRALLQN